MRLERLSPSNIHLYDKALALYRSAFPVEERRDTPAQHRILEKSDYHFDLIRTGDDFIGIMLYWETDSFVYLEHFATLPELRGQGHGSKALELLKKKNKLLLLEIEPPVDDMTQRRYGFYLRNGLLMNPIYHIQVKYFLGARDLELKILSYPRLLEIEEYRAIYEYLTREAGIPPHESKDVTVRPLEAGDDVDQVARLIYLTDPYIFPGWFDSMEEGVRVIRQMIDLPTLYHRENITVAATPEGLVAGILVSRQAPFAEDIRPIQTAFHLAGIKYDQRSEHVFQAYYAGMGRAEDGCYIANVSVDQAFRKRGIAVAMMNHVLSEQEHCTLDCVAADIGTQRLYQRLGFQILSEYPGVYDVPRYKMCYHKAKKEIAGGQPILKQEKQP